MIKLLFFEALGEYGKDFEAIQNHIVMKAKKRGEKISKNKDHVRLFYYRMWHNISKYLKFPPTIKKGTQELYGLINFGELHKRLGFITEKTSVKLNELVYSGSTSLRVRGRNWRVRTPLCKTLRKLNSIEECSEELRLPTRISVELRPRYNEGWTRVQGLSQNPRVRTILTLHCRLKALLLYLNSKWSPIENKFRQKLESEAGLDSERFHSGNVEEDSTLHIGPKPGTQISQPTVRMSEMTTSSKISLQSYEERVDPSASGVAVLLEELISSKRKNKSTLKRQRSESISDKLSLPKNPEEGNLPTIQGIAPLDPVEKQKSESVKIEPLTVHWDTEDAQMGNPDGLSSPTGNGEWVSPNKDLSEPESSKQEEEELNNFDNSWTIHNCGATRIGDVYLMFGSKSKVRLDYWWEKSKPSTNNFSHQPFSDNQVPAEGLAPEVTPRNDLATTLKKLLSIAKLQQNKTKVQCPCGHVCGGDQKQGSSTRARVGGKTHEAEKVEPERQELKLTVCPLPLDSIFRKPLVLPKPVQPGTSDGLKFSLDKLRTKSCSRKGRARPKPVPAKIVPLLPKPEFNQQEMFSILSNKVQGFKLIAPAKSKNPPTQTVTIQTPAPVQVVKMNPTLAVVKEEDRNVSSPTSFSNLLNDLSLPGSSNNSLLEPAPSFVGVLKTDSTLPVQVTPPVSPSRLLKEEDSQWFNSEVVDFSLSSFLNHLEAIPTNRSSENNEDSRLSDVETRFSSLLNENCTDLTSQISDLTAQISADTLPTPKYD
uniref:SANT domain-containing protein n=1 Tax=Clastoptera arizonana TaxID=38151 RepID=A0A1B6CF80_9HEMI